MRKNSLILGWLLAGLLVGCGINRASAQIIANDDAEVYTGWAKGTNYGFGFGPWVLYNTGGAGGATGFAGNFLAKGSPADTSVGSTNGNYWGMYANNANTASSEAFRAISNSLPVNTTFKIRWHNTGIGFNNYNAAGFSLRHGDNTNLQSVATFLQDGSLFAFYYMGAGSDNYLVYDGHGTNAVPVSFNEGNTNGLTIEVTLLPNSTYNLLIENGAGTTVLWSTNGLPLAASGTIDSLAMFDFDTSGGAPYNGNQNFNDTEIFYLAPQLEYLSPANGSVYVAADNPLSFLLSSAASTISSNQIQLVLNGAVQTGADWVVNGNGNSTVQVVVDGPFQANQVYNGTVIAADASGNSSTNSFTFNTWSAETTNIFIEASDYNYNGGGWINNFTTQEPNQNYGLLWMGDPPLFGITNIDFYIYDFQETNNGNAYRVGDPVYVEPATDVDHDEFAEDGFTPYDVGYNEPGQWEDYTRALSNVTYAVYARVSGFPGGTIDFENMATPEVSTTDQPGASLGQFNVPDTGGAQDWTFAPLTDLFGNPVLINFGGISTNTFRTTDISGNGSYNLGYIILVAVTNTATLGPYLSSGLPSSNASVGPLQTVSFTIANQQTSVNPASIQVFINSVNVTGSLTVSNNAAGTLVSYQPVFPNILPNGSNTEEVIFSDGTVSQTDTWTFVVQGLTTLPGSWALPLTGSYARGFSELIAKGEDSANSSDFPPSVARAEAQLAGTLTNSSGLPYANEALNGGVYVETNTINYAVDSVFAGIFNPTSPFPDLPTGATNNVALEANLYAYLSPGIYNFGVYSDDGFQFSAGPTNNIVLGVANYGRAATGTEFSFAVTNAGLYPMQLIYFKAQLGGGGVELYSINSTTQANVLLNDPNTAGSVPIYYVPGATAPTLSISVSGGQAVLTWNNSNYVLQSAPAVTGPWTTINGSVTGYHYPLTGKQQYFRLVQQ